MSPPQPSSVLFCCDHNAIRSPMAEGIMKSIVGMKIFVQSAGLRNEKDIDGYAIAVCEEINVEIRRHTVRSFQDLADMGGDLDSFDLIIALSPASASLAQEMTGTSATEVEFWDIADPTGRGESRETNLAAYREIRDDITARITQRFAHAT